MKQFVALALAFAVTLGHAHADTATITIDVHDADISAVIALLASESGTNVVPDGSLKPERVTLHLHDVTFAQALAVLVEAHGLAVRREGNVLIVGSADAMNRRYASANSQLGAQTAVIALARAKPDDVVRELTPALPDGTVLIADRRTASVIVTGDAPTIARARSLVRALDADARAGATAPATKAYVMQYVRASDAIAQLKLVRPDGIYVDDSNHNAVVVEGDEDVQTSAAGLLATIDRSSPQVLLEVKVADVTPQNDESNVGFEWGGADLHGDAIAGSTAYAFARGSIPVNVRLNALIAQGRAQILATPKLMTLNNREADLLIGETYPIVYNTSVLGGQNVQFVDIGVKLRLTPTIGSDGIVTAELHPEYSELLGLTSSGYPIIANRKIDSVLRVRDAETIVLGGLMRDVTSETISRVPGLSQIPVLGAFFKNKQTHHERDEIVFFITPHVIRPTSSNRSR
ncbi:MAG: type II secretion system protein GspD [bacterium]|nr:type II secretion system protein GspD [bacterium]